MGVCISSPVKFSTARRSLFRSKSRAKPSSKQPSSLQPSLARQVLSESSGSNILELYHLGKELGRGEFGITYECVEIATGETYACKMISKAKLRTEIDVQDVRREVAIMTHLPNHPNIVTFKKAFEDKKAVYLLMELCHGGELFDRIVTRGHYTERAAATVVKTIVEIVKVCHEHGVIHRDLKPENFLFADGTETAALKAIDFGLSILFEAGQRFSDIVGSPYYMAPEVLRRNYGKEVDIWSTGVILYILLSGVPPFWAESEEGIAHAIIKGRVDFNRDPWPKVSSEAKELVKGMLELNPFTRLTATEVLEHPWIRNAENVPLGENVRTRIKQFSLMNKFKKKALRVVADNLPDEQVKSMMQMFEMMDTDKNGDLSFEELKEGLNKIGHSVTDPEVQMLMEAADIDGNGMLSCQEFMTMLVHLKKIDNDEPLSRAFRFFDKNLDGYIEVDELNEALMMEVGVGHYNYYNNNKNNEQLIQDIMMDVDLDKDGKISYAEFKAMMNTGMDWKMASRHHSRAMLNAFSIKILKHSDQLR